MSVFDRVVNLGKGMVRTWRNDRDAPAPDGLEAELDAMRDSPLRTTTRDPGGRPVPEVDDTAPPEPAAEPPPTLDKPLKRTL